MTGSTFVAITIFYSKKLQVHPQPLIAYICLCEAISCWNQIVQAITPQNFTSYFGINELFSLTLTFQKTDADWPSNYLCYTNQYTIQIFIYLSLCLNLCLCVDLILTLRNPFYPSKRRMKYYLGFSTVVSVALSFGATALVRGKSHLFSLINTAQCNL